MLSAPYTVDRSLGALDSLNFLLANVKDGLDDAISFNVIEAGIRAAVMVV